MKNSDWEKKYENLNSRKRELDEEKGNIQRQMEKKDSEINELNTKLNEKITELKSLQSDKQVLDEQLVNLSLSSVPQHFYFTERLQNSQRNYRIKKYAHREITQSSE